MARCIKAGQVNAAPAPWRQHDCRSRHAGGLERGHAQGPSVSHLLLAEVSKGTPTAGEIYWGGSVSSHRPFFVTSLVTGQRFRSRGYAEDPPKLHAALCGHG